METASYFSMAELIEKLPGITEELILKLAERSMIPGPIPIRAKKGDYEAEELMFPSVTWDIIHAADWYLLALNKEGCRVVDLEDAVSLAIRHDVLPLYCDLWRELREQGEHSTVMLRKIYMLSSLHTPTSWADVESRGLSICRLQRRKLIIEKIHHPNFRNELNREDLEDAINYMKSTLGDQPWQDRLNIERRIRTAEQYLARLAN